MFNNGYSLRRRAARVGTALAAGTAGACLVVACTADTVTRADPIADAPRPTIVLERCAFVGWSSGGTDLSIQQGKFHAVSATR
ncbi:hypothetical protein [Nocardia sp. NPDC057272]|uniref:hypothetical protein n=1 Tax=Nocardia sp. NPDC057272 TaxID=3346079 RepID=UPI0036455B4E